MGWGGTCLVEPREGIPDEHVIEAGLWGHIVFEEDGPALVPAPRHDTSHWPPPDPDWEDGATAALRGVNPRLHLVEEEYVWDDGVGPVYFETVSDGFVRKPVSRSEADVDDPFALVWRYLTSVNKAVGCIAYNLDEGLLIDLTLDVDEARDRYWLV